MKHFKFILLVICVAVIFIALSYFNSKNKITVKSEKTNIKIISIADVPGIAENTLNNIGKFYDLDENVIYYKDLNEYDFLIKPYNRKFKYRKKSKGNQGNASSEENIFEEEVSEFGKPIVIKGGPADINNIVNEIIYINERLELNILDRGLKICKVATNHVYSIFKDITVFAKDILLYCKSSLLHPIEAAKKLYKGAKELYGSASNSALKVIELINEGVSIDQIYSYLEEFSNNLWLVFCDKTSKEHNIDYALINFDTTRDFIENESLEKILTIGTVEIAALFVSWTKISKLKYVNDVKKTKTMTVMIRIMPILNRIKNSKALKPVMTFGEKSQNDFLKTVKLKSGKSNIKKKYSRSSNPKKNKFNNSEKAAALEKELGKEYKVYSENDLWGVRKTGTSRADYVVIDEKRKRKGHVEEKSASEIKKGKSSWCKNSNKNDHLSKCRRKVLSKFKGKCTNEAAWLIVVGCQANCNRQNHFKDSKLDNKYADYENYTGIKIPAENMDELFSALKEHGGSNLPIKDLGNGEVIVEVTDEVMDQLSNKIGVTGSLKSACKPTKRMRRMSGGMSL
ncbi:MAG: hypothetical protein GXO85_12470 [Chlorobi bacterium]|nr:hypothetical protein [Chlorobiota bacterium]